MRLVVVATLVLVGCVGAQARRSDAQAAAHRAVQMLLDRKDAGVWTLLRQNADNTVRSFVIRDIPRLGVSQQLVIQRLRTETDVSARRALILVLGGYAGELQAGAPDRSVRDLLLRWHESDSDSGVHSAIAWLVARDIEGLRGGRGVGSPGPRPLSSTRDWYVTAEGHTMAIARRPGSVVMGSPADEPDRQPASDSPAEPLHQVRMPRSFALATTEVTRAQFRRFLDANPDVAREYRYPESPTRMSEVLARFSPGDRNPAIAITWYEAAMYCNWLSAREGLPPSEWVYPVGRLANDMRMPPDYLHRTGYRLPTEAEWELAARAGATTSRFFGSSVELLPEYAWFARNPPRRKGDPVDPSDPQQTSPVGRLKPNDFGLFDIYGNVWEWTQDRVERHQTGNVHEDIEDTVLEVLDQDARTRRGGAFPYEAAMARSAARGTVGSLPTTRRDNVGFRVARTIR